MSVESPEAKNPTMTPLMLPKPPAVEHYSMPVGHSIETDCGGTALHVRRAKGVVRYYEEGFGQL
jgi:hypothetical protein